MVFTDGEFRLVSTRPFARSEVAYANLLVPKPELMAGRHTVVLVGVKVLVLLCHCILAALGVADGVDTVNVPRPVPSKPSLMSTTVSGVDVPPDTLMAAPSQRLGVPPGSKLISGIVLISATTGTRVGVSQPASTAATQ